MNGRSDEMLGLAARVERLEGPDRAINHEIHLRLFGAKTAQEAGLIPGRGVDWVYNDPERPNVGSLAPWNFTGDLNCAEHALPDEDGWPEWQITRRYRTGYHASVGLGSDGLGCETAILALLSQALRARAAMEQGQ